MERLSRPPAEFFKEPENLIKGVKKVSFSSVFTYVKADLDLKLAANFCLSVLAKRFCCWRFFFNPLKYFMKAVHFIIASHFSSAQTDKKISLAIYFKQYQTIYPPNTAITPYFVFVIVRIHTKPAEKG